MRQQTYSAGTEYGQASRGKWAYKPRPFLGQVQHLDGSLWNIRDVRTTKHGFDIYFGSPVDDHGIYRGGLAQLIDTKPLYDFWDVNRLKGHGFLFDLPAGRTTLKRARKRMGFNYHNDIDDFWLDRLDDLRDLPARQFAATHGFTREQAVDWRQKLLGRRARFIDWWRTPETYAILLSAIPLRVMGEKLGIKTSHTFRLRNRARLEPLPGA